MSRGSHVQSLETPLDPELLRAVPLQVCLQGSGKHWKRSLKSTNGASAGVNSFGLSRRTEQIDYFFSHDWETSRFLKWLTLLVMFNSPAAAISLLIVTGLISTCAALGGEGVPQWLLPCLPLFPMLTYAVILIFWQKIRSRWKEPMVFLDRLCIAQHDMALKEQGIRGLGCFLSKSRNLTILWSGRYFSRLWCLYELASYLKDENIRDQQRNLQILPVHLCLLLIITSVQSMLWIVFLMISLTTGVQPSSQSILFNLFGRGGAASIPLALYVGLGCMTQLYQLPQQLLHFQVQEAECFCCSNNHKHPETGKELPCDRQLVFSALQKWFGDVNDVSAETWMHRFNMMVRKTLSRRIALTVGRGLPPFSYVLSTVCVAPFPFLCFFLPLAFQNVEDDDDDDDWNRKEDEGPEWMERMLELLVPPLYGVCFLLLVIQVCRLLFYLCQRWKLSPSILLSPSRRAVVTLLASPIVWVILVYGVWVPVIGQYSEDLELTSYWKLIFYLLLWGVVAAHFLMPIIGGRNDEGAMRCSDDGGPIRILGKTEENFREVVPELVEEAAEGDFYIKRDLEEEMVSVFF